MRKKFLSSQIFLLFCFYSSMLIAQSITDHKHEQKVQEVVDLTQVPLLDEQDLPGGVRLAVDASGNTTIDGTTTTIVDGSTAANTKVNIGSPSTINEMVNIAGAAKMKIAADTFGWESNMRNQMNNALGNMGGFGTSASPGCNQFTTNTHGNWSFYNIGLYMQKMALFFTGGCH